jgi:BirA family biotin operon repressor/biotin-[acetyl-CoA-carboxylase] ligase
LDEVDSTSSEAMRRAAQGEFGPAWIIADRQVAGRGRSGRGWTTPAGNLATSYMTPVACPITAVHHVSLLAGVAAHDAIASYAPSLPDGGRLRLKWPNDILLGAAKLGGILTESTTFDGGLIIVIGFGVNIAVAPDLPDRPTACLAGHVAGEIPSPEDVRARIAAHLDGWRAIWSDGAGFEAIRAAWLERALPIGHYMTINAGGVPESGTFAGLDLTGALLLNDACGQQRRFSYGDVTLGPVIMTPR